MPHDISKNKNHYNNTWKTITRDHYLNLKNYYYEDPLTYNLLFKPTIKSVLA
jgi:hypothetical protein